MTSHRWCNHSAIRPSKDSHLLKKLPRSHKATWDTNHLLTKWFKTVRREGKFHSECLSYLIHWGCWSNFHTTLEIYTADGSEEAYLQEKTDEIIRLTGEHAHSWNEPSYFDLWWIKGCRNKQADVIDGADKNTAAMRYPHTSYHREPQGKKIDFPC